MGDTEDRSAPTLVTALQGKQVLHVAASSDHTICTTTNGFVFTWGGECGKLVLGDDKSNKLVPTLVRGEVLNKTAVQVAAGIDHSICVADDATRG